MGTRVNKVGQATMGLAHEQYERRAKPAAGKAWYQYEAV